MKGLQAFILLVTLFCFASCSKDSTNKILDTSNSYVPDTIKPLDYFPAYPGSYWVYDNNETLSVAQDYELHIFNKYPIGYPEVDMDSLILPKLNLNGFYNNDDDHAYVNGYSISRGSHSLKNDLPFMDILTTTIGTYPKSGGNMGRFNQVLYRRMGRTVTIDTTISVRNQVYTNVLITEEWGNECNDPNGGGWPIDTCIQKREYYAKDIGLIKREKRKVPPIGGQPWITSFEIVSYYINN